MNLKKGTEQFSARGWDESTAIWANFSLSVTRESYLESYSNRPQCSMFDIFSIATTTKNKKLFTVTTLLDVYMLLLIGIFLIRTS